MSVDVFDRVPYYEPSSATISEPSEHLSKGNIRPYFEPNRAGDRSPSPAPSECSISASFSTIATTDFAQSLSDIEFAPADIPHEMVPSVFLYAVARGNPADVFEDPREQNVQVERMPRSYQIWAECSVPLSRFLFKDYWRSRRETQHWDLQDEMGMKKAEEEQERINKFISLKQELNEMRRQSGQSEHCGPGMQYGPSLRAASSPLYDLPH